MSAISGQWMELSDCRTVSQVAGDEISSLNDQFIMMTVAINRKRSWMTPMPCVHSESRSRPEFTTEARRHGEMPGVPQSWLGQD